MKAMKAIITALTLLTGVAAFAQPGTNRGAVQVKSAEERSEMMRERLESRKVSYITDALDLTPKEAQNFWPVYNEHQAEKEKLREKQMEYGRAFNRDEPMTVEELDAFMEARFSRERSETEINEKYYDTYKKVLPAEKVGQFYKAEREFKREVMRNMRKERAGQGRETRDRSQMRQRQER